MGAQPAIQASSETDIYDQFAPRSDSNDAASSDKSRQNITSSIARRPDAASTKSVLRYVYVEDSISGKGRFEICEVDLPTLEEYVRFLLRIPCNMTDDRRPSPITSTSASATLSQAVPDSMTRRREQSIIFGIPVEAKREKDFFIITNSKVNIYGIGDTQEEAEQNYKDSIIGYFELLSINENRLSGTLKKHLEYLRTSSESLSRLRTDYSESERKGLRLHVDEETYRMCFGQDLLPFVFKLDFEIHRTFQNVTKIMHKFVLDADIPEKGRLSFEIYLQGDPSEILQNEKKLHAILFSQIPEEKQHLFLLTYRMP